MFVADENVTQSAACSQRLSHNTRAAETLSLGLRIPQADADPFDDQRTFKFSDGTKDGEDQIAGWRTSVELLGEALSISHPGKQTTVCVSWKYLI